MTCSLDRIDLVGLDRSWPRVTHLDWPHVFSLPSWLAMWWRHFGARHELYLHLAKEDGRVLGVAPLMLSGHEAAFIGSPDLCDYLDFVVAPGEEDKFSLALLDGLSHDGVERMSLCCLRRDSFAMRHLLPLARSRGCFCSCEQEDVSLELELPASWDDYLGLLDSKQRHEVRRKLRRLFEAGEAHYEVVSDAEGVRAGMDTFFRLFTAGRDVKAAFLSAEREQFFRSIAEAMSRLGILRLGRLQLNAVSVAALLYFEYGDRVFLYNSGFDPCYRSLSVGLLAKVLCIQDSIARHRATFDFLKGIEEYKYRLGGREVPVYRCQFDISAATRPALGGVL
ncbi:MAG: GNAT family N-acetyltransferase [Chloroflexota bacterium]